ncbi:hypothetical protein V8E55_012134 [Tylopilus felleus]
MRSTPRCNGRYIKTLPNRDEDAVDVLVSDEDSMADSKGSEEEDSDAEQILSALHMPPADATIPELCKTLALCQKSLTETRAKLRITTKELQTLSAALPLKKRKGVMNRTGSLDENIGRVAKKFAILHRLWISKGFFPIEGSLNPNIDLFSANRWDLSKNERDAVLTELFGIFTSTLNQERSNMLRAVKESSALIFAPLKVSDPTIFFAKAAQKRDDLDLTRLTTWGDGFLKSPVLINSLNWDLVYQILRLLMFGKNALTKEKARGGPKARGQIHGI